MPINWMTDIGISFDDLNNDHKYLFGIFDRIKKVSKQDCDPLIVGTALAELNEYTTDHFRREAAMMKACSYPDIEIHMQDHAKLERQLNHLLSEMSFEGNDNLCTNLLNFIEKGLVDHKLIMDKAFYTWAGENETIIK